MAGNTTELGILTDAQRERVRNLFTRVFRLKNQADRESVLFGMPVNETFRDNVNYAGNNDTFVNLLLEGALSHHPTTLATILLGCKTYVGDDIPTDFADILAALGVKANPKAVPYPTGFLPSPGFPAENPFFTGRVKLLKQIADDLRGTQSTVAVCALNGLGGVGKTQTATAYCYAHKDDYHAIFWLRADNELSLITSLANLCNRFGVPSTGKLEEDAAAVLPRLFDAPVLATVLVVYDNGDNPNLIAQYRLPTPNVRVLITSRAPENDPRWDILGDVSCQSVDVLSENEAVDLFQKRVKSTIPTITNETADIKNLCDDLGHLPLAIEQAAAYVKRHKKPVAEYRRLFATEGLRLIDQQKPTATDYEKVVGVTWKANFDDIAQNHPEAVRLAQVMAFIDGTGMEEELVGKLADALGAIQNEPPTHYAKDEIARDEAFGWYADYSLIGRNVGSAKMHRLTQAAIRHSLPDPKTVCEQIVTALRRVAPEVKFENWKAWGGLIPHIQRVFHHADPNHLALQTVDLGNLLNEAGYYLQEQGLYPQALPLYEHALAIRESELGASHPSTATSLNNLALLYKNMGNYADALPLYERTVQIFESELGASHPDTATSLNNLALLYQNMGRVADALPLYERALAIRESELGASHPSTATSLNNLAALYEDMGRVADALPLFERALAICESELGASHPDTATSLNNLAVLHANQGDWEKALPLMQRAVQIRLTMLVEAHPYTQGSIEWLNDIKEQLQG